VCGWRRGQQKSHSGACTSDDCAPLTVPVASLFSQVAGTTSPSRRASDRTHITNSSAHTHTQTHAGRRLSPLVLHNLNYENDNHFSGRHNDKKINYLGSGRFRCVSVSVGSEAESKILLKQN
jgi:hypothetical protein